MANWPHLGPRAAREFAQSVVEAAETWILYCPEWERRSGIPSGSSLCHERQVFFEATRPFCGAGRINLLSPAGCEPLVQIETVVGRSVRSPDFSGLSGVLAGPIIESGAAVTKNFAKWVAARQKDGAQALKNDRVALSETKCENERHAGGGGGGGGGRGRDGGSRGWRPRRRPQQGQRAWTRRTWRRPRILFY